jgi:hypothetical protein
MEKRDPGKGSGCSSILKLHRGRRVSNESWEGEANDGEKSQQSISYQKLSVESIPRRNRRPMEEHTAQRLHDCWPFLVFVSCLFLPIEKEVHEERLCLLTQCLLTLCAQHLAQGRT